MPVATDISNLMTTSDPYSVKASVNDGLLDTSSSVIKGNMDSELFKQNNDMGKMDFLKLLVTQLQHQDPLDPMDNAEFVSQLAQFSALEGNTNIEKAIVEMGDSFNESVVVQSFSALSMTNASAVSLIGKSVRIGEASVKFSGIAGENAKIQVHLGNSDKAEVQVLDYEGNVIRTFEASGKDSENSVQLSWDGKNDAGEHVQAGNYYLNVVGQDKDASLYCFVEDIVTGVRYGTDGPLIKIGGKEIPIGNIMDISMSDSSDSKDNGLSSTQALSMLGKIVKYEKDELTYSPKEGQTIKVSADLSGYPSAIAQVFDSNGKQVHSFELNSKGKGFAEETIDCIDFNQNGPYTIKLAGNTSAFLFNEGTVDGLTTANGITYVRVNGVKVALSEIIDISDADTNTNS